MEATMIAIAVADITLNESPVVVDGADANTYNITASVNGNVVHLEVFGTRTETNMKLEQLLRSIGFNCTDPSEVVIRSPHDDWFLSENNFYQFEIVPDSLITSFLGNDRRSDYVISKAQVRITNYIPSMQFAMRMMSLYYPGSRHSDHVCRLTELGFVPDFDLAIKCKNYFNLPWVLPIW